MVRIVCLVALLFATSFDLSFAGGRFSKPAGADENQEESGDSSDFESAEDDSEDCQEAVPNLNGNPNPQASLSVHMTLAQQNTQTTYSSHATFIQQINVNIRTVGSREDHDKAVARAVIALICFQFLWENRVQMAGLSQQSLS